ncbi:hypothetical protein DL96DRAFT_1644359 [Flagelloscypha sp. PMI_526]|nr:hypothetical protein DL96DRAFT_1644359 [Flagelloscypha sp. PMI_526]
MHFPASFALIGVFVITRIVAVPITQDSSNCSFHNSNSLLFPACKKDPEIAVLFEKRVPLGSLDGQEGILEPNGRQGGVFEERGDHPPPDI